MNLREDGPPRGQTVLDPALIERIKALVGSRTRQGLNDRFGISYNTWRKLIAGDPVRTSLAARLQERVRRIEISEPNRWEFAPPPLLTGRRAPLPSPI